MKRLEWVANQAGPIHLNVPDDQVEAEIEVLAALGFTPTVTDVRT